MAVGADSPRSTRTGRKLNRQGCLELTGLIVFICLLLGSGVAFFLPWSAGQPAISAGLARYSPSRDGSAWLYVRQDAAGQILGWSGQNATALPALLALGGRLPDAQAATIFRQYPDAEAGLPGKAIYQVANRRFSGGGEDETEISYYVYEPRGMLLTGIHLPASGRDLTFEPGLLYLPADLSRDGPWESTGQIPGLLDYRFRGQIIAREAFVSPQGVFNDCIKVEARLIFTEIEAPPDAPPTSDSTWHDWYCSGVGMLQSEHFVNGELQERMLLLTSSEYPLKPPDPTLLPASPPALQEAGLPADPEGWVLSQTGRTWPTANNAFENSISPVWLPVDPPLLLGAANRGELVAFHVSPLLYGQVAWSFRPGGSVFGVPRYHPATGLIYFGASDKRLYAIDGQGFFRWSFETQDNVAGQPLAAGDRVIFVSEDKRVYALDAGSGALRWQAETGSAMVASPVLMNDLVVVGGDDGLLQAFDLASGALRWQYAAGDAIEAPLVVQDGVVFAPARDGRVYAVDGQGGEVWASDGGEVLRTAALVRPQAVYVVDDYGVLKALDRQTGRRLWETVEDNFAGPPVWIEGGLLLANYDGRVYHILPEGRPGRGYTIAATWDARTIQAEGEQEPPSFELGPTVGGGALWFAERRPVIYRLGPALPAQP